MTLRALVTGRISGLGLALPQLGKDTPRLPHARGKKP